MQCNCCRECRKRQVGCHSTCEDYLEFVRQNEEEKEKIRKIKELDDIVHRFGLPGVCFGEPTKRRTKRNRVRGLASGSC